MVCGAAVASLLHSALLAAPKNSSYTMPIRRGVAKPLSKQSVGLSFNTALLADAGARRMPLWALA
jgi:hypothetical protein